MKSSLLLTCSLTACLAKNLPPIIGIVLQPLPKSLGGGNYVASSYVKWIEAIGGVVVPLMEDDEEHLTIAEKVDGIVFPGGSVNITRSTENPDSSYAEFAYKIYAQALRKKTPVLGICQGFQQVGMYTKDAIMDLESDQSGLEIAAVKTTISEKPNLVLEELKVYNKLRPINWFTKGPDNDKGANAQKWYGSVTMYDKHLNALSRNVNHHYHNYGYSKQKWIDLLGEVFDLLDIDVVDNQEGKEFVNMVRMKTHFGNVWGMLPHPEKNAFEHVRDYEVQEVKDEDVRAKEDEDAEVTYDYNQPNTMEHDFDTIMALYSLGQPFVEAAKENRAKAVANTGSEFFWTRDNVFKWSINARENLKVVTKKNQQKIPIIFDSVYLSTPQGVQPNNEASGASASQGVQPNNEASGASASQGVQPNKKPSGASSSAHIFVCIPLFVSLLSV